ncbi:hypothetical protein GC174_10250 [bacterium]|nr:hypothetical protein [bacterium]
MTLSCPTEASSPTSKENSGARKNQDRTWYKIRFVHSITNSGAAAVDKVKVAIAAPGDGPTQRIRKLNPQTNSQAPVKVEQDQYGQKILTFQVDRVNPGQTLEFGYESEVSFGALPPPAEVFSKIQSSRGEAIPEEIKKAYAGNITRIYDLENSLIKNLARHFIIKYPRQDDRVRAIHHYVASNLKYKEEGRWDSAPQVLARGTGSCSEYSYVFSALCRATGMPTRFAAGSRLRRSAPYTDSQGHRWCEVYFPGAGWVPFDPTLDSKHPQKPRYVGSFFQPSLITFHGGGGSSILKNAYNSTNTRQNVLSRKRNFYWQRVD